MADREVVYKVKADTSSFKSDMNSLKNIGSDVFKGIGTAVGVATTAAVALGTAAVATGKKLYNMVSDTAKVGDAIDKNSQKLGLSKKAYQEWDYILSQSGVDISNMTMSLKTLSNQIDDANNGNEKAIARFEQLGITVKDLATMSREDIFSAVISGFQNMGDTAGRAALASDLLGRSSMELQPLFNETAKATENLRKQAHELGMVMSDEAVEASADMNDAIDTLQRTFSGLKNNLQSEMLPSFTNLLNGLSDLIAGHEGASEKINAAVKDISKSFSDYIPKILDFVNSLVDGIAEAAPDIIESLVGGIINNLPKLLESAGKIITALANYVFESIPTLLDTGSEIVKGLAKYVGENAGEIVKFLFKITGEILEWFLDDDNLGDLVDAGGEMLDAIGRGLWEALPDLWTLLKMILTKIGGEIRDFFAGPIYDIAFGTYRTSDGSWVNDEAVAKKNQAMDENHYMDYQIVQGLSNPQNLTLEEWQRAQGYDATIKTKADLYAYEYQAAEEAKAQKTQVNLEMDGFRVASGVMRNIDDAAAYNVDNHFQ